MNTTQEIMDLSRKIAWEEVSRECVFRCKCGKLLTGFHEAHCGKFQRAVDTRQRFVLRDAGFYKEPKNIEQVKVNLKTSDEERAQMAKQI